MAAGNPTLPAIDATEAGSLENTVNPGTGTLYKPHGVRKADIPSHATHITMWEHRVKTLIAGACAGMVVDLNGRNVGAFALHYQHGATLYSFPGETSVALDASDDHYIYLDADEVLEVNHVAFPADSYHLAYAVTNADDITTLEDRRWENADVGGTNNWSAVAATQDVDIDNNWLKNVKGIDFSMPAGPLTIAAGEITPASFYNTLNGEGGLADDLDTINETSGIYPFLLLKLVSGSGTVTVKHNTGNILLPDGDCVMDDTASMLLLMRVPYIMTWKWIEVSRNRNVLAILAAALNCNGQRLFNVGALEFEDPEAKTIAAGAITITQGLVTLTPQTGNTDDLDSIAGAHTGQLVALQAANAAYAITVKHSAGIGELSLANNTNFVLNGIKPRLVLLCVDAEEGRFVEWFRTPMSIEDLVNTARSIPYPIQFSSHNKTAALVAGVLDEWRYHCPYETVIVNATGYSVDAPVGNACIIDIQDDGASIFANEGEMINIAAAANQDTSATKNHVAAAGSILTCEIKNTAGSPNGADHLTVSLNCHIAPKNEP